MFCTHSPELYCFGLLTNYTQENSIWFNLKVLLWQQPLFPPGSAVQVCLII